MTAKGPYGRKRGAIGPCKTLGERIRAIRLAWGWTQSDLAEKLGAGQQLLSHWERGVAEPSSTAMASLCAILNISQEAMSTGKGFSLPDLPEERPANTPKAGSGRVAVRIGAGSKWEAMTLDEAIKRMHEAGKMGLQMCLTID